MPFQNGLTRIVSALAGLALVGCHSPYRQSPYNPYGGGVPMYNPQPAPVQPQFGPPGGSPTPVPSNGGVPGGSFPPSGNSGFQNNGGSQLQPQPDPNSNSFPPTDGGSSGDGFNQRQPNNNYDSAPRSNGQSQNLVPNEGYGDPEDLPPSTRNGNTFEGNSTPFSPDGAAFQRDSDSSSSVGNVAYEPPGNSNGSDGSEGIQLAAHEAPPKASPSAGNSHPYGYDAEDYRWLQGLVDFDEGQNAWVMIYDTTPDAEDQYKGQITLVDNALLDRLNNNDLVMVEGRVDTSSRDPGTGKPQYRVEALHGPFPQS